LNPYGFKLSLGSLWFPRFKRTTPTLLEFGGNTLNSYNTEREAFWKDVLMPEKKQQT